MLYQRMLDEIAEYARVCNATGWSGFGIPEHHLQIEGFELGQDPGLMAMFLGQHAPRLRIDQFGYVLGQGILDRDKCRTTLELFAEKVIPRFRG